MSDYAGGVRRRRQNLLVVEGSHEKHELFWLIFRCFPEIDISMDDVWIYGTNIYLLYEDIVKEYGEDWPEDDIDLPFVISRKQSAGIIRYKADFTNIILVFDYERHDTNFSESRILEMQNYFADATDAGKLYLNYPMIESYQHLCVLPDPQYMQRTVPVSLRPGKEYKALVRAESAVTKFVRFPHKMKGLLKERFGIEDEAIWKLCCDEILNISAGEKLDDQIQKVLQGTMDEKQLQTARNQIVKLIADIGYTRNGQSYWDYMRDFFKQIIYHNVCKANQIQNANCGIIKDGYKELFERVNLEEILKIQNQVSRDSQNGFIWVLNTCVFFVAEYNFSLVVHDSDAS